MRKSFETKLYGFARKTLRGRLWALHARAWVLHVRKWVFHEVQFRPKFPHEAFRTVSFDFRSLVFEISGKFISRLKESLMVLRTAAMAAV